MVPAGISGSYRQSKACEDSNIPEHNACDTEQNKKSGKVGFAIASAIELSGCCIRCVPYLITYKYWTGFPSFLIRFFG